MGNGYSSGEDNAGNREHQLALAEDAVLRISGGEGPFSFTGQNLGDAGASRIAEVLKANVVAESMTVRWLHLDRCGIGDIATEKLAEALGGDSVVQVLDLDCNTIGDAGAASLAKALKRGNALRALELHFNSIGPTGTSRLAEALETNAMLRTLSLHGNDIGDSGAVRLAKALMRNKTLLELQLGRARLGDDGASSLGAALEYNSTLKFLHICHNAIGDVGALRLAESLEQNRTLCELWLLYNPIGEVGSARLGEAVQRNGVVQRLGLSMPNNSTETTSKFINGLRREHTLRRAVSYVSNGGEYLRISNQELGDAGASKLADAIQADKELRELRVESAHIGDAGCIRLGKVMEICSSSLERLSLAGNEIGDVGAKGLALTLARVGIVTRDVITGDSNAKLREVCLDYNVIGNKGAVCLAVAAEMSISLVRLSLLGNAIGHAGVTRLAMARENSSSLQEVRCDDVELEYDGAMETPMTKNSGMDLDTALGVQCTRFGPAVKPCAPCDEVGDDALLDELYNLSGALADEQPVYDLPGLDSCSSPSHDSSIPSDGHAAEQCRASKSDLNSTRVGLNPAVDVELSPPAAIPATSDRPWDFFLPRSSDDLDDESDMPCDDDDLPSEDELPWTISETVSKPSSLEL